MLAAAALAGAVAWGCSRPTEADSRSPAASATPSIRHSRSTPTRRAGSNVGDAGVTVPSSTAADSTPKPEPLSVSFAPKRTAYVVLPAADDRPARLIAGLHGVCNPPEYACGYWIESAFKRGLLVCPTGNARCGVAAHNAPTWQGAATQMDRDLERAVAAVRARFPARLASPTERSGAVLMGFSKGAYGAIKIALAHRGRWPHLVLIEASVRVSAASLRQGGVRSVALVAGERSSQRRSMERTAGSLRSSGYPAKLWIMPRAGHHYSDNIDAIMAQALDFVIEYDDGDQP